jgi:hypothetical protein
MVVHTCNLSCLGSRDRRIKAQGQLKQKVLLTPCLKNKTRNKKQEQFPVPPIKKEKEGKEGGRERGRKERKGRGKEDFHSK